MLAAILFSSAFAPSARPALRLHASQLSRTDGFNLIAPTELWPTYLDLLSTAPITTKAITAGIIIGSGDCAAQLLETRDSDKQFDSLRASRWAFFGLVLQGPWNHFFYLLLDGALPPTPDPFTVTTLEKVGIDQFVQAPIFTMIILIFFAVVEGKGLDFAKNQIRNDLGGILVKNWAVFLPATAINIGYCPPEVKRSGSSQRPQPAASRCRSCCFRSAPTPLAAAERSSVRFPYLRSCASSS